jgi:hypothetical protein
LGNRLRLADASEVCKAAATSPFRWQIIPANIIESGSKIATTSRVGVICTCVGSFTGDPRLVAIEAALLVDPSWQTLDA